MCRVAAEPKKTGETGLPFVAPPLQFMGPVPDPWGCVSMRSTKSAKVSPSSTDSTDGPATNDGAWVVEMRRSDPKRLTVEGSSSQGQAGHALFEQTFHYLRGFLDRRYQ